jgi:hypothetical protein
MEKVMLILLIVATAVCSAQDYKGTFVDDTL